jgi:hypothetical protein
MNNSIISDDLEIVEDESTGVHCFYKKDGKKEEILNFDTKNNELAIFPINTIEGSKNFLKPKYPKIHSIIINYEFTENKKIDFEEILKILENLPSGFIKDYSYGLGFLKDYRFIINEIESQLNVHALFITDTKTTYNHNAFFLNSNDFDTLRRVIDRTTEKYRFNGNKEKSIITFNSLFPDLPQKKEEYEKDVIYKFLRNIKTPDKVSEKDHDILFKYIEKNVSKIACSEPEIIGKLENEYNLIKIEKFKNLIDKLITENANEDRWQKVLNDNTYIFSLLVGAPIMNLYDQATIGGRSFNGKNDSIVDYLNKNPLTNNLSIIEIKTTKKKLLSRSEYRNSIYAPSNELSGSINQILDQKYKIQKELSNLKENSSIHEIFSYHIECLIIIGLLPKTEVEIKSFELFRHSIKDVRIMTFDELQKIVNDLLAIMKITH